MGGHDYSAALKINDRSIEQLAEKHMNIKHTLVGKDALIVGLGNSAFQDILFRAKIHPKRKASDLSEDEVYALHVAVREVITERIKLKGKNEFLDLYGKQGRYTAAMGPNMKGRPCLICGSQITSLSLGRQVFFCPQCQK